MDKDINRMFKNNIQRTLVFAVALFLVLGIGGYALFRVGAAARASGSTAGKAEQPANSSADDPSIIRFVKDPEMAPLLEAHDLNGNLISTANLKGKVVIVNFWATWCPPCREEIPALIALQNNYKDRLQIIGVSEDDDPPEKVAKFAQQQGMNYPIVMATTEVIGAWGGVPALPTSFVVDPQGRVMTKHMGLKDTEIYDREVRSLSGLQVDAKIVTFVDQGQVFMKNAANATDLPDVDFSSLTPEQKKTALHRMNAEPCVCGCKMTVSQCRINDESCPVSKKLAADIVTQVRTGKSPATDRAPNAAPDSAPDAPSAPISPSKKSSTL